MQNVTKQLPFVIAFLVAVMFMSMFLGEKVTNNFLLLVLAGMIITNSDKVINLMNGVTKP